MKHYSSLTSLFLLQVKTGTYAKLTRKPSKLTENRSSFEIKRLDDQLFAVKSKGVSFIGPVESLMAYFLECLRGFYDCDYKGKTVLDIGGFCGETAVFFASQGAKKVVIYEPVKMHHEHYSQKYGP